mmetsp:Transcript_1139/g.4790  ORF Transcript_1139/g.4790 Transcript_1139/m.4790 type:complete len:257 (+) Transcript_1139:803-1573(+)
MDPSGYRMSLGGRVNAARGRAGSASPDPDPDPEPPAPLPPESPLVAPALPAPPAGFIPRSVFSFPPGYWFPSYHRRPSCSDLRAGTPAPPAAASAAATRNGSRSATGSLSTLGKRFFFSPPTKSRAASFSVSASGDASFSFSSRKPSSSAASPSMSSSSPSSSPSPAASLCRFSGDTPRSASGEILSAGDTKLLTGGMETTAVHVGSSSSTSFKRRSSASLWFRNRSSLRCASKSTACSISANVANRFPPSPRVGP